MTGSDDDERDHPPQYFRDLWTAMLAVAVAGIVVLLIIVLVPW